MNDLIKDEARSLVNRCESELNEIFKKIDEDTFYNSNLVLSAFKKEDIKESDFASSTGYGYGDIGREKIERVYADIFNAEDALVRTQIISGSHALTVTLFGLLRPGDTLLSITGLPYDTLHEVIGIKENASSLKSFGVNYEQIDLINNDFDYDKIKDVLTSKKIKVIEIQRSRGYSERESITIEKLEEVCKFIKNIDKDVIIMIDNCYTEFVERKGPIEVGADIAVGSLIKNLGGGICENGGYIVGRKNLIHLVSERLNLPGEAKEVGPSLGKNKEILMGLYHAPQAVSSSLKVAILTSMALEKMGYEVSPKYNEDRSDIVQTIKFYDENKMIEYARGIQSSSAIDSNVTLIPTDMPGYSDKIIMASGSFTQGSSIEISCDGPIKEPYMIFQQGSLTYDYGKIALMVAISKIM